ncbi:MAG: DegT/DnrJ/EryC1/StrS family aminotransferase [Thermodesulfobacteriota bacterium]
MKVPFVDLVAQYQTLAVEIDQAIKRVIADAAFIGGKYAGEFEKNFAAYCGARHCVAVGNGTDALMIVLKGLKIGPGDEVIVPANTFVATSEAVTASGARVVFADVDPETYNLDVSRLEKHITSRTKAVIAVHLYGHPADLAGLGRLADRRGFKIIQDSAQAHGAVIAGRKLIEWGGPLCFSFYPSKNLGAYGDAGAIVTDDEDLAVWCRMYANHGRLAKFDHDLEGVNSRLDGLQGAILNVKIKYLEEWIEKRRGHAALYDSLLKGVPDLITPKTDPDRRHVYHLYVVRTAKREPLRRFLQDRGVATGIHYPLALPNLTAYKHFGHRPEDFPVASRLQDEILSLPMYPELTGAMIEYVAAAIKEFLAG